jgi:hypothetical protein
MAKVTPKPGPIRPLPGRGGLNDLGKSGKTILDYAKAVPSNPVVPPPDTVRILGRPK